MDAADPFWHKASLDFVDAADRAKTPEDIVLLFKNTIAQAGFDAHLMIALPNSTTSNFNRRAIANGWRQDWTDYYLKNRFVESDPVPRHATRVTEAFEWKDAPFDPLREPKAKVVMERSRDFNMTQGLCVPLHYDSGTAVVSIAGERPEMSAPGVKQAMTFMSLFVHTRLRALLRPTIAATKLSAREREVLTWTAAGKTSEEIGIILNLSRKTVDVYISRAQEKMHTTNRAHTVATALSLGEIHL